jgi:hypothetical protein
VGVRLLTPAGDDELRRSTAPHLTQLKDELVARLKKAGATDVKVPVSAEDAAAASNKLEALFVANGTEIQVRLLAPGVTSFPGPQVLDVFASLGMTPAGDGLEFAGFEVKTRTPPGKLSPRALVDGKLNPTNLLFEMYVPHASRPSEAFATLMKAVTYAQKRLGGTTDVSIETFGKLQKADVPAAKKRVAEVEKALAAAGFPAGSPSARRLFLIP